MCFQCSPSIFKCGLGVVSSEVPVWFQVSFQCDLNEVPLWFECGPRRSPSRV